MAITTLVCEYSTIIKEQLSRAEDADEKEALEAFITNEIIHSQETPVELTEDDHPYCIWEVDGKWLDQLNHEMWLYQETLYGVKGVYSKTQKKLLILEQADKERQKFERLAAKFSKEQSEHIKHERSRISETVRIEVWRRDQGKCSGCGSRVNLEYGHVVPVSRGGSNTARNVELLCEACNRSKGDRIQ